MEIIDKKANPLMKREEVLASVEHMGMATPTRKEFLVLAAKEAKAKPDVIVIDKIFTNSGRGKSHVRFFVYKTAMDVPKIQAEKHKKKLEKGKGAAEEPKEAPPTKEEKPEEKAEETKEEAGKE